jgi:hypothetical protein
VATITARLRWPGQRWDAFRGRTAIEPRVPGEAAAEGRETIPLLFALDNRLGIDEGYDSTKAHVEQLRYVRSDEISGIEFPGGCGGS